MPETARRKLRRPRVITSIRARLARKGMLRNITILVTGTVGAQLITVAAVPVTTRLYTPSDFSTLTVYASLLSLLLSIATFSLHLGIPLERSRSRAVALVQLSLLATLLTSLAVTATVLLGAPIFEVFRQTNFQRYALFLVPGVLLGGLYATLQMWYSRQKSFELIARTRLQRSVGGNGTQVLLGLASSSPIGLVLGHLAYNALGALTFLRKFRREEKATLQGMPRGQLAESLQRNKRYVYLTTPGTLMNVASIQLPVLAIAANSKAGEIGHLHMAMMIMTLPMMLIGSSVGQAFIADAPAHHSKGTLYPLLRKVTRGLFLTGGSLLALAAVAAPLLAGPILGAGWERTGQLIAWMAPWMILQFAYNPVSTTLYILERQSLALVLHGAALLVRFGMVALVLNFAPRLAMEAYATSGAIAYGALLLIVFRLAKKVHNET